MHGLDASGRRISLLNDEDDLLWNTSRSHPSYYTAPSHYSQKAPRTSTTPNTPQLLRSDSYDSRTSLEPISPMTPMYEPALRYAPTVATARSPFDEQFPDGLVFAGTKRRPSTLSDSHRSLSYEDDSSASTPTSERPEKGGRRYPCRFRDIHGCEKTFTTSGHASRHSKIHTSEKSITCSFQGCLKKFTRTDNMKQHLETHYKDKSRSSRPSLSERRSSSASAKSSSRSKAVSAATPPLPPPISGAWEPPHPGRRPSAVHSPASGLDVLALAIACQDDT
ncbi:transcriptional regulator NRG1 [Achaetomium macrosporum]|uniref:Transcriptional regulator NRG1 n=1 Tax=Achaetomium macrosporum TaxID=79813 RepID=A0AAN7CAM6_9PEZI|nr:transcriptional regulator NRG1 [Achaetomium macrosporum]